ncbi:tol-pal system protein YbgF [Polynucleobacter sp. MWH-Loch1C5]|jgi:tol-pal system protein YbgF|uniref:tol-pal system protein YbgF n=1 Tax=Polynucleobacter sp. MWH-Loch1C5 TaxID=2689108 RepID=UPI001C0CE959|nr:tol-pal system protein YbgF [Polynucleobacter sp. MWH-Loch1C5]MBU3542164.1 tol-pal system protein YbgF [Polynucleobacter sp. MWH-Loch1C5]
MVQTFIQRLIPTTVAAALAAVVVLGAGLFSSPAHALLEDKEARLAIINLREQLATSQRAQVDLMNQLEEEKRTSAQQRGQIEVLERQVEELIAQQKTFYQDINNRLKRFEPQTMEVEGVQGTVQPGEKEAYEVALKAFQDSQLKRAENLFETFTKKYSNSPYWPLAQFWLGNAQYGLKNYKEAIANLQALIKKYPLHGRIPDAMLTLGNSQLEAGQKAAAKKTLDTLISKYPESEAANLAKSIVKTIKIEKK